MPVRGQNPLERFRWPTALGLISMDSARPYYLDLGVPPVLGDEFVTTLRERIRRALTDLSSANGVAMSHLRDETLEWVGGRYGTPCRNALDGWVRQIYCFSTSEQVADGLWHDVLLGHPDLDRHLPPNIARKAAPILTEFATKCREAGDRIKVDERRPYTEWDQKILALCWAWADGDDSYRPWDDISNTSLQFRFVVAVASLNSLLNKSELAQLTAVARKLVQPAGSDLQKLDAFPYRLPLWPGCGDPSGGGNGA